MFAWLFGGFNRDNLVDWGKTIVIAGGIALLIRWPITEPYRIPSGSMEPTLHGDERMFRGDRVFVNKFAFGVRFPFMNKRIWHGRDPERWELVVFKSPEEGSRGINLVKRIVGMPGERIHIAGGKVFADGKPLELPPFMPPVHYTSNETTLQYGVRPEDEYSLVPEGHYLVLGDNSSSSRDGRVFGWLPNENILGPVYAIWWPPSSWRDFTGFTRKSWWRSMVGIAAIVLVLRLFVGRSWRVHDDAPDDSLKPGDHLVINRIAFGLPFPFTRMRLIPGRSPRRGELILYRAPEAVHESHHMILGRVAGLGGERVSIEEGRLLIDGQPVQNPTPLAGSFPSPENGGPYGRSRNREYSIVPDGYFFVLSENTETNVDSRSAGWVASDELVGYVSRVWWPPSRWRKIRP